MKPLTPFQKHIVDRESRDHDGCCLFLTMGSGKTRVAIELIKKFEASRVLIVSKSKIVKDTWANQLKEWGLGYMDYVCLANMPSEKQIKILNEGIDEDTIVGTNFETFSKSVAIKNRPKRVDLKNSPILQAYELPNWDIIIIDESTCIKDPTSKVALSMLNLSYNCPNAYVMCLTGTPNPEASLDFYTQISIVDRGKRFGESFNAWRDKYFYLPQHSFKYVPFPFGVEGKSIQEVISELCSDMCYVLTKEELAIEAGLIEPARHDIYFDLSNTSRKYFNQMKQNVIEMPEKDITALNAGIVISKLLQISSGIVYGNEGSEGRQEYFFGLDKINACVDLVKQIEGKVIVCYDFLASKQNLELYLGLEGIEYAHAETTSEEVFEKSTNIKVLLLSPRSGAYGTNYQADCHNMIWYELTSSGEKFVQTEGRVDRRGQKLQCHFWYLLGRGTYDSVARNRVMSKETKALDVLKAIKKVQKGELSESMIYHDVWVSEKKDNLVVEVSPFDDEDDDTLLEDWYLMEDMF